ncbi:MAG: Gfo/Idh/MocA family oxidoreductase [Bauldia sp.]|nr:Gfo/Idh/MocA family oxidoreductase [Bauldia sp.]
MTVRVGLIGAGVMGGDHARILSTSVNGAWLAAVSDADAGRAKAIADAYGATTFADADALIADDSVEAVIVASPDPTHKALVLACLEAEKPVLCEKPLGVTTAECLEIVAAEAALGKRLVQVGFMRRFDPGYTAMKAMLDSGELGRGLILHCVHRNQVSNPYSTSEGVIANSAVHELDIARWMFGEEVERITVVVPRQSGHADIRDPQIILMHMAGGAVVDVEVYLNCQYGYDVRGELVCESGTAELVPPHGITLRRAGQEGFGHPEDWRPRFTDAYRIELQAWIDSVTGGPLAGASAWDGYAATAIAEAGIAALKTGTTAEVRLEAKPGLYGG